MKKLLKAQKRLPNKKEQAYTYMRDNIRNGVFSPGYRLVIDKIKKDLNISSIPVREAMQQLQAEKLIEVIPYSGAVVKMVDEKDYEDLQTISAVLEGYADRQAALHLCSQDISELEKINHDMQRAIEDLQLEELGTLDHAFHWYIVSRCQNRHLIAALQNTWEHISQIRNVIFTLIPWHAKHSVTEHAALIQMLKEHTAPEEIERFSRQHKLNVLIALKKHGKGNTLPQSF